MRFTPVDVAERWFYFHACTPNCEVGEMFRSTYVPYASTNMCWHLNIMTGNSVLSLTFVSSVVMELLSSFRDLGIRMGCRIV